MRYEFFLHTGINLKLLKCNKSPNETYQKGKIKDNMGFIHN